MSLDRFFGRWQEQAHTADESGRWRRWVGAAPALGDVGSAYALGEVVTDRMQQARANELLYAPVRVGSVDGGEDESAVTFVAALLVPGADRLVRSLCSLGSDVAAMVAGQLWIQVREYPWRSRPRAVAKNTLLETRRAVLADYGATAPARAVLVPLAPPELVTAVDGRAPAPVDERGPDVELIEVLAWARNRGALTRQDAALLWELVLLACDEQSSGWAAGMARGVSSVYAGERVAAAWGVNPRSVRRRRDRAVRALRLVSRDYEIEARGDVQPGRVLVLTEAGARSREGTHG
ncbi:MAG: hypothetical protein WCG47_00955 [Dermatophilaceae bacterium]